MEKIGTPDELISTLADVRMFSSAAPAELGLPGMKAPAKSATEGSSTGPSASASGSEGSASATDSASGPGEL